jgi:hypothetical protein
LLRYLSGSPLLGVLPVRGKWRGKSDSPGARVISSPVRFLQALLFYCWHQEQTLALVKVSFPLESRISLSVSSITVAARSGTLAIMSSAYRACVASIPVEFTDSVHGACLSGSVVGKLLIDKTPPFRGSTKRPSQWWNSLRRCR